MNEELRNSVLPKIFKNFGKKTLRPPLMDTVQLPQSCRATIEITMLLF